MALDVLNLGQVKPQVRMMSLEVVSSGNSDARLESILLTGSVLNHHVGTSTHACRDHRPRHLDCWLGLGQGLGRRRWMFFFYHGIVRAVRDRHDTGGIRFRGGVAAGHVAVPVIAIRGLRRRSSLLRSSLLRITILLVPVSPVPSPLATIVSVVVALILVAACLSVSWALILCRRLLCLVCHSMRWPIQRS